MSDEVKSVPEGFHTLTPGLVIRGAAKALEFYKEALGAEVIASMTTPDGQKIVHAEIKIGNSMLFLSDEFPEMGNNSPESLNGSPVSLNLYVEDADAAYDRAIKAGATSVMPVAEQFWGDRWGIVTDPFGHHWSFSTHVKDLTHEEVIAASHEFFAKMAEKGQSSAGA